MEEETGLVRRKNRREEAAAVVAVAVVVVVEMINHSMSALKDTNVCSDV